MFGLIKAILAGSDVLDRLTTAERRLRELQDDLTSLEDRHERLHGRIAKRRDREASEPVGGTPDELDARRAQLNESILARRQGVMTRAVPR